MPVTINVSSNIRPCSKGPDSNLTNHVQIFDSVWGKVSHGNKYEELLQSTFSPHPGALAHDIATVRQNGFIETVVVAYNRHHSLAIKPDDVWIAILTQFSLYVNAHREEMSSKFVVHEGKKELTIDDIGTRYSISFAKLALALTARIQENVLDPDLQSWILPDFTTTTSNDTVVCSALMMSTLKSYFSYTTRLKCGIPNVTLLGEKTDWEKLLSRLGKLETFGEEPATWASFLRPILMRFIAAFDGYHDKRFWSQICHVDSGSGSNRLSGWIAKFCVWNEKGKWIGPEQWPGSEGSGGTPGRLLPHMLSMSNLPPAICSVDVKLDDNGKKFDCVLVAGHIGNVTLGTSRDTLGMVPAWFMAIKQSA